MCACDGREVCNESGVILFSHDSPFCSGSAWRGGLVVWDLARVLGFWLIGVWLWPCGLLFLDCIFVYCCASCSEVAWCSDACDSNFSKEMVRWGGFAW